MKKKQQGQVTGIITDRVVCQMPGCRITIEEVDGDGYYAHFPLGCGRELYLYGGAHRDISFDLHVRGEDSCRLATFNEVIAFIDGVHAATAAHEHTTQPAQLRPARKSRRSR